LSRPSSRDHDWIGLSEASRLLGVSPATVRRWSDRGRLRVYTTPGGHRRFSRTALEHMLPADRSRRPSLGGAGLTPSRLARTYRRSNREASPELPWVLALSDEQRVLFRERGQVLAATLLQYLDATRSETAAHHLKEASGTAAEYGRAAVTLGRSLSPTVEG
jgi:excisionase family DNA binding protein